MQVNVSVRHGHLASDVQQRIQNKAGKLTRFFDRINAIEVTVDLEHQDTPKVEVRVSAERSEDFIAQDQSSSVIAALDQTLDKVENQIRRHKEKLTGHRATGHKHLEVPLEPEAE